MRSVEYFFDIISGNLIDFIEILGGLWGARMDTGYRNTISTLMKALIDEVGPHNLGFVSSQYLKYLVFKKDRGL